jgi:hypothetical protein
LIESVIILASTWGDYVDMYGVPGILVGGIITWLLSDRREMKKEMAAKDVKIEKQADEIKDIQKETNTMFMQSTAILTMAEKTMDKSQDSSGIINEIHIKVTELVDYARKRQQRGDTQN